MNGSNMNILQTNIVTYLRRTVFTYGEIIVLSISQMLVDNMSRRTIRVGKSNCSFRNTGEQLQWNDNVFLETI